MKSLTVAALAILMAGTCLSSPALAQQGDGTNVKAAISVLKPARVDATPQRIATLKAPQGFAVTAFATNLKNPRILAVTPDGGVYASRRDQGDVIFLKDANGDGKADSAPLIVANRPSVHGLAIKDGKLYMATVKEIFVADILPDGKLGEPKMIAGDLPDGGQHPNRTIAFGPDGMLYVSIGSTCNACNESNPEHATMLRMSPDGKSRTIFASHLRNTIGFAWHPVTGELWGMDHGIDDLGDNKQAEELNLLQAGKGYGWPHVFAEGEEHPQTTVPGGITKAQWKADNVPMTIGYTAHAAPMQMLFYSGGNFGDDFQNDGFIAMRGSWNRDPASGYEIVRIRYKDGKPQGFEPFVTGFLTDAGKTHIARPVGLAMAKDGSLLMADDANGVIYRVAKTSGGATTPPKSPPADKMIAQTSKGIGVPLALARPETASAKAKITVTSPTIAPNGQIPTKHSDYADGVSPLLTWTAVPKAKSYAIIMEDPDAKPITPFVHWVAWNIPPNTLSLPEGLQEQARLTLPDGMRQGHTSKNTVGYFGPQPPVGDPAHHYHFQVFALDAVLNLPLGATRDDVLTAAKGHVIGEGELVGAYAQTVKPPKAGG
ncbi:MAG: YbhB/YbcL family Raf kinase inhibitor-like protein [Burkholderiales bacterium]|nr:MAG: YbhB/YbcL family Raf kinase inhibitor-like protein [Burkholderiales bacterium]